MGSRHPLASVLAVVSILGAIALPLTAIAIWLLWDTLAPVLPAGVAQRFDLAPFSPVGFAVLVVLLIGAGIQAWGLLGLTRTFKEAAASRALSNAALSGFQRFAWVSVAMVPLSIAQHTAIIALFTGSNPSVPGQVSIQLGSSELTRLFFAVLLVFVATVFAEGQAAKDENASFL